MVIALNCKHEIDEIDLHLNTIYVNFLWSEMNIAS